MAYDPYAYGYNQDNYGYYDPNQGWYDGNQEPQEDTASQKLRKEQEMIEAIESNRLYLRKVRRGCVKEDFADLEKTQMFLFEFLIETLEVNTKSELGLVPETEEASELVARVKFLDTPYLEIREKGEKLELRDSVLGRTEYFETIGNAGLADSLDPRKNIGVIESTTRDSSQEQADEEQALSDQSKIEYDTKWENSSGKSLLFSKSALEVIQGLDKSPIKVQISTCVETIVEGGEAEKEDEEEKEGETFLPSWWTGVKTISSEPLGYVLVRLPDHFSLSVLQSCKSGVILPVSCIHRELCKLTNVFGAVKGELQVFVRLSCFGPVITTSFQSTGPERRYVFKPSPLPDLEGEDESEVNRETILKPIVAEEEVAIGITIVSKKEDPFHKSVVWKNNPDNCGCLDLSSDKITGVQFKESSLRMPCPSDVSLCRDAKPCCKPENKFFCDWHNLVAKEIKNNPGGNCGCLGSMKDTEILTESAKHSLLSKGTGSSDKPSRIKKLLLGPVKKPNWKVSEKGLQPIKGLGMVPEPTDCNCDCPQIKTSLALNPMMKATWQIK